MKKYLLLVAFAAITSVSFSSCAVHAGVNSRHHGVGADAGVGYHESVKTTNSNS